jgi:FlaA1/EpsC-like NDP-sugar epimerase
MELSKEKSIKKFYEGSEVFITGGSGFIGKVLVEKLLRSCSGVDKIYLLMRPKRGLSSFERINQMADNLVRKVLLISLINKYFFFNVFNSVIQAINGLIPKYFEKITRDRR